MIKEFSGEIMFMEIDNADGFYRVLPGYPSFICLHEKYQGKRDLALDAVIALVEASKSLTPRQKCLDQIFWLVDGKIYKAREGKDDTLADYFGSMKKAPALALAGFSRN